MEKPEEPIIYFPIDRINKFLENHIFEVSMSYGDIEGRLKIPIKVKLVGMKDFISVGEWRPYITYEFHVIPGDKTQNFMSSIYLYSVAPSTQYSNEGSMVASFHLLPNT